MPEGSQKNEASDQHGVKVGTEQAGSTAAAFSSGNAALEHSKGLGLSACLLPGAESRAAMPDVEPEKVFIPVTHVCFCRSKLLCRNHDNSCRHRGEGGRLQHLPLPQRGLVEAGAVLQARVPGQAGSVVENPLPVALLGKQPSDDDDDDDKGTSLMLLMHPTSRQLEQGHQQNLQEFHTSRGFYLWGRVSFSLLSRSCPALHTMYPLSRYLLCFSNYQCFTGTWWSDLGRTKAKQPT